MGNMIYLFTLSVLQYVCVCVCVCGVAKKNDLSSSRECDAIMLRSAPPIHRTPQGLVGSPTRVQEVANPGLPQQRAAVRARQRNLLKDEIAKLSAQVAALELKLAAKDPNAAPELSALVNDLHALTAAAGTDTNDMPTSAREIGAAAGLRPATAPYRSLDDSGSIASWSADAHGKSKTPGWYHTCRKQLYKQRATRAAAEPAGCFISHSKYADEAVRIAATDRPGFSTGKRHHASTPRA